MPPPDSADITDPTAGDGSRITAALVIIGNEILSGRTQDINLNHIANRLGDHGIRLVEARVIADVPDVIQSTINALRQSCDYVFTTGGIGPTHDDITAENVAAAFGVPLITHPEAKQILVEYYAGRDLELNAARLRMACTPEGASLIENPVSAAPGFIIGNVYVMAGVPRIMQAMLENVLPHLRHGVVVKNRTIACTLPEGLLATPLGDIQARYPTVDIGSYPGKSVDRFRVNLVLRGEDEKAIAAAAREIETLIESLSTHSSST